MSGKGTPFSRESSNKCQPSTLFTGFFVRYTVWPRLLPPITQIWPVATWEYMRNIHVCISNMPNYGNFRSFVRRFANKR